MKTLLIISWIVVALITYRYIISIKPVEIIKPANIMIYERDDDTGQYSPIFESPLNNNMMGSDAPEWICEKDKVYKFIISY